MCIFVIVVLNLTQSDDGDSIAHQTVCVCIVLIC